jgi:hypothetical protein
MREVKSLNGVTVKQEAKAIEVSWTVSVVRDDGSTAAATPFNRAYGQYDREQFLLDMASEPTAGTYADLAGLEVRAEQPTA